MKRLVKVGLLFFAFFASCYSFAQVKLNPASMPWSIGVDPAVSTLGGDEFVQIKKSYEKRFGAFPDIIIWSDTNDTTILGLGYTLRRRIPPEIGDTVSSERVLSYLKDHVKITLKSVKNGTEMSVNLGKVLLRSTYHYKNLYLRGNLFVDCRKLPVPADTSAWILKLAVDLPDTVTKNIFIDHDEIFIAKSKRISAIDSLEWALRDDHIREIPVAVDLLKQFPTFTPLLQLMFDHYTDKEDVDSMRYWGVRLNDCVAKGEYPFTLTDFEETYSSGGDLPMAYVDSTGAFHSDNTILEYIHSALRRVAGDTTLYK